MRVSYLLLAGLYFLANLRRLVDELTGLKAVLAGLGDPSFPLIGIPSPTTGLLDLHLDLDLLAEVRLISLRAV